MRIVVRAKGALRAGTILIVATGAALTPMAVAGQEEWRATAALRGGIAGAAIGLGVAEVRAVLFDDRVEGDLGLETFLPVLVPAGVGAISGVLLERRYGATVDQAGDMLVGIGAGAGLGALTGLITEAIQGDDPMIGFWSGVVVGSFIGAAGGAIINRTRHITDPGQETGSGWIALGAGVPVFLTIAVGF